MRLGDLFSSNLDWLSQQSDYNCPIAHKCPDNDSIGAAGYRPIREIFEEIVILLIILVIIFESNKLDPLGGSYTAVWR